MQGEILESLFFFSRKEKIKVNFDRDTTYRTMSKVINDTDKAK